MPGYGRHLARTPAFIGWLKFVGGADRKSRNGFERNVTAMVVVDDDDNIGFVFLHPFTSGRVAIKQGLPVSILGEALVHGGANGGNVGTTYACGNFCHWINLPSC